MIEALILQFLLGLLVGAACVALYFLNRRETEVERKLSEIQSVLGSVQDAASLNLQMEKCRASGLWPKEIFGLNAPAQQDKPQPPYVLNPSTFSDDQRGHA